MTVINMSPAEEERVLKIICLARYIERAEATLARWKRQDAERAKAARLSDLRIERELRRIARDLRRALFAARRGTAGVH